MRLIKDPISVSPYKKGFTSAKGLIKILRTEKEKVKKIEFIPPKIGSKSLGKFYVELDDYLHNETRTKK